MRRIEFIAPVEAMRGNLSGKQVLKYAENMNPAWDAPNGKQFAKNYKPRYVGAKRSASGLTYFATKERSAVRIDEASKLRMAAMGCVRPLISALSSEDCYADIGGIRYEAPYTGAFVWAYTRQPERNGVEPGQTFEKWAYKLLYDMLVQKKPSVSIYWNVNPNLPEVITTGVINNPFGDENIGATKFSPVIAQTLYNKFIGSLFTGNLIAAQINKQAIVFSDANDWSDVAEIATFESTQANRKALCSRITIVAEKAKWDGLAIYDEGGSVQRQSDTVVEGEKYTTTTPA